MYPPHGSGVKEEDRHGFLNTSREHTGYTCTDLLFNNNVSNPNNEAMILFFLAEHFKHPFGGKPAAGCIRHGKRDGKASQ